MKSSPLPLLHVQTLSNIPNVSIPSATFFPSPPCSFVDCLPKVVFFGRSPFSCVFPRREWSYFFGSHHRIPVPLTACFGGQCAVFHFSPLFTCRPLRAEAPFPHRRPQDKGRPPFVSPSLSFHSAQKSSILPSALPQSLISFFFFCFASTLAKVHPPSPAKGPLWFSFPPDSFVDHPPLLFCLSLLFRGPVPPPPTGRCSFEGSAFSLPPQAFFVDPVRFIFLSFE